MNLKGTEKAEEKGGGLQKYVYALKKKYNSVFEGFLVNVDKQYCLESQQIMRSQCNSQGSKEEERHFIKTCLVSAGCSEKADIRGP